MSHPQVHKEDFQLERIAFFSDAVFAIAITLLIIEIKVPERAENVTDHWLGQYLLSILGKLIGFFVSFFVIGMYWMSHHRLFRYITSFNPRILWPNMFFLLPIIIMPFSTAFFSEFGNINVRVPILVYTINILFAGLMSFRLWRLAASPKYNMSTIVHNKPVRNYNLARSLTVPLVFLLVCLLSFVSSWIGYLLLYLLPVITGLLRRYFKRKYPVEMEGQI